MDDPDDEMADESPEARFGAQLRRLRVQAGLSLRQLAERLHRSHSTISEFESGRRLPAVEVVEQYEDHFKLARGTLGAQRERARAERLESPRDGTVEERLGEVACPYKGLQPFEPEDADVFFGRETQVQEVMARLAVARFVAVVGASGSGKSSFVRAGLLAAIMQQTTNGAARPRVALLTPGERPLNELTSAVSAAIDGTTRLLPDDVRADPDRLRLAARHACESGLVIAVDQFEELFTQCNDDIERRCFVDALVAAWRDPASPVTVIIALRADFYGSVDAYPELTAAIVAHQTKISPMTPVELRRAIELPAAHTGLTLQPGLTDTMLDDLTGEPGALPLLSHALLETWQRRRRLTLTVSAYRDAGGVRGAIAQTAERTLQRLPEDDQAIARQIFLALTDITERAEPTRRRVDRDELTGSIEPAQRDRVLAILAAMRLVTIDEHAVTVAHEALIRHWPRLRGWIETDRAGLHTHRRLTAAAREWDTLHREPAALYRGARLAIANEWATEHPDHLTGLERDFLTTSHDRHCLEVAAKRRRMQYTFAGLAGALAVVSALAVVALIQRSQAGDQRDTAQATLLATNSLGDLSSDPSHSLRLGMQAYATKPTSLAEGALRVAASRASPQLILRGNQGSINTVVFARDSRHLASAGKDGTVRVWDRRAPHAPRTILRNSGSVFGVVFTDDGRHFASAEKDGTVRIWDLRSPHAAPTLVRTHDKDPTSMTFAPDGRHLASVGKDGTVRVWDLRSPHAAPTVVRTHDKHLTGVRFAPDGRHLASVGKDGTVRVWDWHAPHKPPTVLSGQRGPINDAAFAGDGRHLAVGGADGAVRVWDWRAPHNRPTILRGQGSIFDVAFADDGRHLASAGNDGTVRVWDWRASRTTNTVLRVRHGFVTAAAFASDGRHLAGASIGAGASATVQVWDLRAPHTPPTILREHQGFVGFARDGRHLASAGDDGTVRVWDWRAPRTRPIILRGQQERSNGLTFASDGHHLASGGRKGTVHVWDWRAPHTPPTILRVSHQSGKHAIADVAFADDGRHLASATIDGTVRVWDWRAPHTAPTVLRRDREASVTKVAFADDGRHVASAGNDGTVQIWDWRAPHAPPTLLRGHGFVVAVAFAEDGRHLAIAGTDGTVRVWDWRAPQAPPTILRSHHGLVNGLAFAPDGRHLAGIPGNADGTVQVWQCQRCGHINRVLKLARARLPREIRSG